MLCLANLSHLRWLSRASRQPFSDLGLIFICMKKYLVQYLIDVQNLLNMSHLLSLLSWFRNLEVMLCFFWAINLFWDMFSFAASKYIESPHVEPPHGFSCKSEQICKTSLYFGQSWLCKIAFCTTMVAQNHILCNHGTTKCKFTQPGLRKIAF